LPVRAEKKPSDEKGSENWDAPLTGCVVVFVFEEISLMVFSINEGSFNF